MASGTHSYIQIGGGSGEGVSTGGGNLTGVQRLHMMDSGLRRSTASGHLSTARVGHMGVREGLKLKHMGQRTQSWLSSVRDREGSRNVAPAVGGGSLAPIPTHKAPHE
jgi:hypothetical protein